MKATHLEHGRLATPASYAPSHGRVNERPATASRWLAHAEQTHWQTPLEQDWPDAQVVPHAPQFVALVRSEAHEPLQQASFVAQSLSDAHAVATLQTFAVAPPPHVSPAAQVPQESCPPHPSGTAPQSAPAATQVVGTQVDPLLLDELEAPLELLELLELLVLTGVAHAPPRHSCGAVQSASEAHDAPQTPVVAHDSPAGQAAVVEQLTGAAFDPIGTSLDVEQAAADKPAKTATRAPKGRPNRTSEAGESVIECSWAACTRQGGEAGRGVRALGRVRSHPLGGRSSASAWRNRRRPARPRKPQAPRRKGAPPR
jgi:hypothetical protein